MNGSFFPEEGGRENCNFGCYATIAVRAYCTANTALSTLLENSDDVLDYEKTYIIDENNVICETFSAFAIESFLNTYAAACLGDSVFYDNFDKLSALSKLQLVAAILYRERIDKQGELFYLLKHSFSVRNLHAHNKSKRLDLSQIKSCENEVELEVNDISEKFIHIISKRLKEDTESSLLSVKAIVATACYIDKHDSTAYAKIRILSKMQDELYQDNSCTQKMRDLVRGLIQYYDSIE